MRDNTVKDYDGNSLDIYEHKIYALADDYINTVINKPEDISKKQCFGGMIKYISTHIDKPDINNLVLLDRVWSIYTTLCYKYNHVVTVERYCILININRDTFYTWYKGERTSDRYERGEDAA